jgi:hypothetical protein
MWHFRLVAFAHLQLLGPLAIELAALGDLDGPSFFYEYYAPLYPSCRGVCIVRNPLVILGLIRSSHQAQ